MYSNLHVQVQVPTVNVQTNVAEPITPTFLLSKSRGHPLIANGYRPPRTSSCSYSSSKPLQQQVYVCNLLHAAMQPCSYAAMQLCSYAAMQLCSNAAMQQCPL